MNITNDPIKSKINLQKHQIDLADIEGIFYDARALTIEDRDHDHMEPCYPFSFCSVNKAHS